MGWRHKVSLRIFLMSRTMGQSMRMYHSLPAHAAGSCYFSMPWRAFWASSVPSVLQRAQQIRQIAERQDHMLGVKEYAEAGQGSWHNKVGFCALVSYTCQHELQVVIGRRLSLGGGLLPLLCTMLCLHRILSNLAKSGLSWSVRVSHWVFSSSRNLASCCDYRCKP